jgi:hypothetical protein
MNGRHTEWNDSTENQSGNDAKLLLIGFIIDHYFLLGELVSATRWSTGVGTGIRFSVPSISKCLLHIAKEG